MKQVNEFSKRLDKIFNDGEPTKALIIDAYIKTNPTAQSEALNIDDVSNSFKKGYCKLSCIPSDWHKDGKCGKNGCWHK